MSAPTLMAPGGHNASGASGKGRIGGGTGAFWLFVGPFVGRLLLLLRTVSGRRAILARPATRDAWVLGRAANYIDLLQPGRVPGQPDHVHTSSRHSSCR